jgi:hypothetical protein
MAAEVSILDAIARRLPVLRTLPVDAPIARLARALGLNASDAFDVANAWRSAGLVELLWRAPDGWLAVLTPLGASRLGVRPAPRGDRWVRAGRPDPKPQCGHGRSRTIGATDGRLDLDALPARVLEPLDQLLVSEERGRMAERRRESRQRARA